MCPDTPIHHNRNLRMTTPMQIFENSLAWFYTSGRSVLNSSCSRVKKVSQGLTDIRALSITHLDLSQITRRMNKGKRPWFDCIYQRKLLGRASADSLIYFKMISRRGSFGAKAKMSRLWILTASVSKHYRVKLGFEQSRRNVARLWKHWISIWGKTCNSSSLTGHECFQPVP